MANHADFARRWHGGHILHPAERTTPGLGDLALEWIDVSNRIAVDGLDLLNFMGFYGELWWFMGIYGDLW